MRNFVIFAFALALMTPTLRSSARTWTDADGEKSEADLLDFNDRKVWLLREDDRIVVIERSDLSEPDQAYVQQAARHRATEVAQQDSHCPPDAIHYGAPRKLCDLANSRIDESSGLACSRTREGVFWTHNDSDDAASVYAFDRTGKDLGSAILEGVDAFDWEDIASLTLDGKHYLLIGDIGNNVLASAVQILYLVEEPAIDPQRGVTSDKIRVAQVINFSYEDDHRNCEGLAVDPTTKTIYLVSKEKGPHCYVYALSWPPRDAKKAAVARKIATLNIPMATSMDISPDGRRAIVATYGNAFEYTRRGDEDWATAFARPGRIVPLPTRAQGESICYGPDGKTLYLTSEKLPAPLWEVPVNR